MPTTLRNPHFIYGGDYNPDQWTEDIWLEDARLMREAGVNLVSMGIFSWSKMEPRQDEYDFGWLDRLMDILHEHGVSVNLGTPTASPPAWLVRGYPDVLPVTDEGTTLWHGSRRHYCPHSPSYHARAKNIVTKLAERYAAHPALAMWHVDNEYASGITECFCDTSAAAFREWLKERYKALEKLNEVWGTAFWSQHYSDWEEIYPPRKAPASINPSQLLDWARFNSDSWVSCFEEQKTIINQYTPNIPVTTNFMGFHKPLDYWKLAAREDVVSQDSYPDTFDPDWMIRAGMICDLMRSLGDRRPWIMMEQAPTHVNWRQRNATKRPGVMRLCSYQAIARGADGVMFFQWRASKAGSEKHHSGMLPHIGTESRVWREVKAFGNEPQLDVLLTSQVKADVAILLDWESWWALELDGKPSNDLKLMEQVYSYYKPFFERNITVDFAHPESDLSKYKLVVAPNLYLVNDNSAKNINQYIQNGGNLVMSFFSGIVDENEHIRLGGYPAPFRDMLGLVVEEFAPYSETQTNSIRTADGRQFNCTLWGDIIHLKGAEAIVAVFEDDYYAGSPAITQNIFGKGNAFYVGTVPDNNGMEWIIEHVCKTTDIQPVSTNVPVGVEVLRRTDGNSSFLFVLNHSGEKVKVPIEGHGHDLLTGADVHDSIALEPAGVAVIQI